MQFPCARWLRLAIASAALVLTGCAQPLPLTLPGDPSAGDPRVRARPVATDAPIRTDSIVQHGSGRFAREPVARSATAIASVEADGVTLNLVNASIQDAAKSVLGDILQLNYSVSDKIKGTITLQTSRPIKKDALIHVLENVLRAEGVSIVVTGSQYRLLPTADAIAEGAPITAAHSGAKLQAGRSTRVMPLKYISAAEAEKILKSISPQSAILRVDQARNMIVASGAPSELDQLADALYVFDVDVMRGMSFAIFPMEDLDPEAVAQELDAIFSNDRDGPTKGIVRLVPNRRLRTLMIISSRPEFLKRAEQALRRIEVVGRNSERRPYVYRVQHRSAAELAQVVRRSSVAQDARGSVGGQAGRGTERDPANPPGVVVPALPLGIAPNAVAVQVPPPDAGGATRGPAREAEADAGARPSGDAARGAGEDRAGGVHVVTDEQKNALVITATAAEYEHIKRVLDKLDTPSKQVLIEATIAEVTLNDKLRLGLRWYFQSGKHQFALTDDATGAVVPSFPGFNYFIQVPSIKVALSALSSVTDVNVVSTPTLMVLDNKKAVLQVGDEVPIATQSAVSTVVPGAPIVNAVSFRSTGIILGITPRASDSGQILLDIEQEVSDVVATTTSKIDSPTIQQRRVRTTVSVPDGGNILIAGLMQDRSNVNRDQIPILGDLPVIGNAFKTKTDGVQRTELLIAITPRIIKDTSQIHAATEEYRAKLNLLIRPQRHGPPDREEQWTRIIRGGLVRE